MMEKNSLAADLSQQLDAEVYKRQQAEHERDQLAAEVERVKRLEAVAEAADKPTACFEHADNCCIDWCDLCRQCQQNQDALDAALAAWREGEA
jgi:hypothetical protein